MRIGEVLRWTLSFIYMSTLIFMYEYSKKIFVFFQIDFKQVLLGIH